MPSPPHMSREALQEGRSGVGAHDHAVCAYDSPEELLAAFATFVAEGRERDDLIVFVHSFPSDDEAWRFVHRAAPDIVDAEREGLIVVSLYETAFEGGARRIDYEHVGRVVDGLTERANAEGRRGTRIFVDASRTYFAGSRASEWFAFEEWLGVRLQAQVGLVCAYQRSDIMKEDVLPRVLQTHAYRFRAE